MIVVIPQKEKILLVIERDSYQKDAAFIKRIVAAVAEGYRVVWYNPHGVGSSQLVTSHPLVNALPKPIRLIVKALGLLRYPKKLLRYLSPDAWREATIEGRVKNLKKYIKTIGANTDISIFSRSAGGRIASLVADELGVSKIICLGYPFKHPEHDSEPERYEHLAHLQTPMLILQGARDEYGGREAIGGYALSPRVLVELIETDHDFVLTFDQFDEVVLKIKDFLPVENC